MSGKPVPIEKRFWAKVDKSGDCWEWTRKVSPAGYGSIWHGDRMQLAHRVSYEMTNGQIPSNLVIDHKCHNTKCVNPDHLQAVTQKQNLENKRGAFAKNRSGIRGVSWNKAARKWAAYVRHEGKTNYVGLFTDIKEAEVKVIAKRNELFTNNLVDRRRAA
jgi:hypothetical protein